jgi:serine-type D-Ala-D-Ala carboxypeptidase (penicillin-binding protein 5/6)
MGGGRVRAGVVLRLSKRQRQAVAAVLAAVVVIVVVVANQPSASNGARPQVKPAAARAVATQVVPPKTGPAVLRVMHAHLTFSDDSAQYKGAPKVDAAGGILVDVDSGSILWARDPHTARPPASTAKILSTLVALENFDPDRVVTITPDALTQAGDETVMGLHAGDQLTVRELLQGMLLVSGNDAADAMAVDTVGMDSFVNAMNQQLGALGLRDSHFVTPVGLDDPAQLASPYDLAAIAAVDVAQFPLFRQIVATTDMVLPASSQHPEFDLHNLNRLLRIYPVADGVKPGWTGDAGPCLVAMAERNAHRLISVVMNAPQLYTDSRALLDWGFMQLGLPSTLPTPTPSPAPAAKKRP